MKAGHSRRKENKNAYAQQNRGRATNNNVKRVSCVTWTKNENVPRSVVGGGKKYYEYRLKEQTRQPVEEGEEGHYLLLSVEIGVQRSFESTGVVSIVIFLYPIVDR